MKIEDINWVKCIDIANATENDDEYSHCAWGSKDDIEYLCECLFAFKENKDSENLNAPVNLVEIFGIPISRIRELFDLFMEKGFNLREKEDFERIKIEFFGGLE